MDAVPDEVLGRAVKAAMAYFDGSETVNLGPLEAAVFAALRADIDTAFSEYKRDVENGKRGGRPRKKPPLTGGRPPQPRGTQGEGEGEGDIEAYIAAATPQRTRFSPPSVDEVTEYCRERGNHVDPATFVDFYTARGWKAGSAAMKDWRAAVRTWERREGGGTRENTEPIRRFDEASGTWR